MAVQGRKKEGRAFSFAQVAVLPVGRGSSQGKTEVPAALGSPWAREERAVIFTVLIHIARISEEQSDPATQNCLEQ